jgi:hypothetical protein
MEGMPVAPCQTTDMTASSTLNVVAFGYAALLLAAACQRPSKEPPVVETAAAAVVPSDATPEPSKPSSRAIAEPTPDIVAKAAEILAADSNAAIGTEVPFELDGHRFVARFEWHDNPDGDPDRPIGRHKGITVYTDD